MQPFSKRIISVLMNMFGFSDHFLAYDAEVVKELSTLSLFQAQKDNVDL